MTSAGDTTPRLAPWRDAILVATASLCLYLWLAQEAFHGLDVHVHVYFLTQGHLEHPSHLLYLRIAGAFWPALEALGMTPQQALRSLSAAGTAIGILCTHRAAAHMQLARVSAALVAALSAVVPSVVFFATVPEIHGVFAAFAGATWFVWARFVPRMRVGAAVVLGLASGVSASVHATGHLLFGLCALCTIACGRRARVQPWGALAVAAIVHGAVASVMAFGLQPERVRVPFAGQLAYLLECVQHPHSLADAWRVLIEEWLLAFMPASVCSLAAWRWGGRRAFAAAVFLGLFVYLVASYVLLVGQISERGAYLLPLAFPFALLTSWAWGTRPMLGCIVVAFGVAWGQVRAHDRVVDAAWLPGFIAVARDTPPAVICRDVAEQEAITRALPDVPFVRVDSLLASARGGDAGYDEFCRTFDAMAEHYRVVGRSVLITLGAYEALLATGQSFFVRFLREHVPRHYRVEEIERAGFKALRVRAR